MLFSGVYQFITTSSRGQKVSLQKEALSLLTAPKLPSPRLLLLKILKEDYWLAWARAHADCPGAVLTLVSSVTLDNLHNIPVHQFPRLSSRAIIVPSSEVSVGTQRDTPCKVLTTIPDAGWAPLKWLLFHWNGSSQSPRLIRELYLVPWSHPQITGLWVHFSEDSFCIQDWELRP